MQRGCLLLLAPGLWAQQYVISTIAGGGPPATATAINVSIQARQVAVDAVGNVYFASSNRVWKLATSGTMTAVAGTGSPGDSGDGGKATSAQFCFPASIAVDSAGNLYVVDEGSARVRKVSTAGTITTVFGNGPSVGGECPATLNTAVPMSVAVDADGNLYVGDNESRVRKVSTAGIVTAFAGNGTYSFSGDGGPAINAGLSYPVDLAVDGAGNVYIADGCAFDSCSHRVRKVSPNGIITTVAGNGTPGSSGDGGSATSAELNDPEGIALDSAGNLYIAEYSGHRIRRVSASGIITSIAGDGTAGYSGDGGAATRARMANPNDVAMDVAGNLYIVDCQNNRIRKISSSGVITTVAGNGLASYSGDGGPASGTQLWYPRGAALDVAGNVYVADSSNARIRKIAANGIMTTVAGTGNPGYSGDGGPATSAPIGVPYAVAVDSAGNLYIADFGDARIRKVSANGTITTVAGTGTQGYSGDGGPATRAQLKGVVGVATDNAGNLYISDHYDFRIRKVSPDGIITTFAGNGTPGNSGDGGPATGAQVDPFGLAVDGAGNLYIADNDHSVIRKVSAGGIITTVAGSSAGLSHPAAIALDRGGSLYIGELGQPRIKKVSANGIVVTIAGNGLQGYSGDGGPATSAALHDPNGLAVDAAGNVYVTSYQVLRLLEPDGPPPAITAVTSAASNLTGSIAPGEIVVLYHSGIGPAQLTQFSLNQGGMAGAQLDRAQVTFNGTPAPLLYTWTTQLAAVVPYSVTGASAQVRLTFRGQTSAPFNLQVASSSPGIFTADSTGRGQAAVLNENGTPNSAQNPAKIGSAITLFATGEGQTSPPGVDGKPGSQPLPTPVLPVTVSIGGQPAEVVSKGGAPGMVAGVMEIKARIPSGATPGNAVPVAVQVGNVSSQSGVTVAVSDN